MKKVDVSFSKEMFQLLQEMVSQPFIKYRANPFVFTNTVFENVGLFIGEKALLLQNSIEAVDYFGALEDICVLKLNEVQETAIISGLEGVEMIDTPIKRKIQEIRVIQERQRLAKETEILYDVALTRGLIFVAEEGYEIAFAKTNPFIEEISISRGENLLKDFTPLERSLEGTEEPYFMEASRTMLILDGKTITEKLLETARTLQKE